MNNTDLAAALQAWNDELAPKGSGGLLGIAARRIRELEAKLSRAEADVTYHKDRELIWLEKATQVKAENERLMVLAGRVLGDFPEYMGFEGFECQEMLEDAGLIAPHTIDAELLEQCDQDYCSCREYFTQDEIIGEICYRITDLGRRAREATAPQIAICPT